MPGLVPAMAGQRIQRETPSRTAFHKLSASKGTQRKGVRASRQGEQGNDTQTVPEKRGTVCGPSFIKSAQIRNILEPHALNVDERLRLARERREERERELVSRELGWLEREERARRYHEKQLEERRKRLLEQRQKEEKRRHAVEEKRRIGLKEEKERCESAVRRTLERSQRANQRLIQTSRGRKLIKNSVSRRLPLSPWEKSLVSRLLTPTCAYLARSKSAGCQSLDKVSCHSMNANNTCKAQQHRGPADHRNTASPSPARTNHRTINLAQVKAGQMQTQHIEKMWNGGTPQTTGANIRVRPDTNADNRARSSGRSVIRHVTPKQTELPTVPEEEVAVDSESLSPRNPPAMTTPAVYRREHLEDRTAVTPHPTSPERPTVTSFRSEGLENHFLGAETRPAAGTMDPEEASRLLAEKRREARQRKQREEEERMRREEVERQGREELERRRAEEQARLQAEAQRLAEERKRREEEEQKQAEAEEARKAMEKAALLQKQREEEQARQQQRAEQLRLEREKVFQQEEAERQARKKRLDEIMKRTRRPNPSDRKPAPSENMVKGVQPKENTEPVLNGTIEEVMKLPVEDMVPVVAFKERRSLRPLGGLEEIQTHQRAEVLSLSFLFPSEII
ncbi:ensconsin isoform X2 [Osmerus eperlanus]|uniref:ensconsin isoform X2 n=1 Tax=Osmerus eperlanus TaxID=29151 RepID=UPI002E1096E0